MVIAAFIFAVFIFTLSLGCLFAYIQGNKSLRRDRSFWAQQQELELKLQADLQARMEADSRRFEEQRRALLERTGGDSDRSGVGHPA
ncbi:MAG TPA: hypothetical protein VGB61_12995 [Pyrinomonadaceae bacterium]|jgi:hypothetical protein